MTEEEADIIIAKLEEIAIPKRTYSQVMQEAKEREKLKNEKAREAKA